MADKAQFEQAQKDVKTLSKKPDNDDLLFLYAHYKQGSAGDVSGKRPGMLDMVGRAKSQITALRPAGGAGRPAPIFQRGGFIGSGPLCREPPL